MSFVINLNAKCLVNPIITDNFVMNKDNIGLQYYFKYMII